MLKKIEIGLRHFLLNTLLLFKNRKKQPKPLLQAGNNVLLIRLNRIGDALVTTPLIKVLAEEGGLNVYVLADKKNSFIFENNPHVKKVFQFQKGLKGFFETQKRINSGNFKLVIDTHPDVSTTVSFIIAGIKNVFTLAFAKGNEKIYSATIQPLPKEKFHIVERLLQFADYLNLPYKRDLVNIVYTPLSESVKAAEEKIKEIKDRKDFLLGVNISAGSEARFWGVENFRKLLNLLNSFSLTPVVLSAPSDREKAEMISDNRYPVLISESFDVFAAMISKLNFLFTPDTSVVHLASAFKIPLFGLYVKYNTVEKEWYPFASDYELVVTTEPTLKNLKFEEVKSKFVPFLEKHLQKEKLKKEGES